jgi:hypothetical protein
VKKSLFILQIGLSPVAGNADVVFETTLTSSQKASSEIFFSGADAGEYNQALTLFSLKPTGLP